ncbi:MAG: TIGR02281 family clan AA aspartic protease [Pseudomonadota bacterium]
MPLSRIIAMVTVLCLLMAGITLAAPDVRVVGLFKGRAVVTIDGKQRILRVGQTSPEGVKLVSADSDSAVLAVDGREIRATLDGRVSARKKSPVKTEVQIRRNNTGMYTTVGSINGLPVSFLVDTGATQIAMNAAHARRLGVDHRVVGEPTAVTTASRVERAWLVNLDTVKVGEIELRNVAAVVLEGRQPDTILLGMSYLGRLEIRNEGQLLTLRKKY